MKELKAFSLVSLFSFDQNMHISTNYLYGLLTSKETKKRKSFSILGLKEDGGPRKQAKVLI